MAPRTYRSGLLIYGILAVGGCALVFLPPLVARHVETANRLGKTGFYVYVATVLAGGLLLLGASASIVWRLWRRTQQKEAGRRQRSRNPSELSSAEREAEFRANLAAANDLKAELPSLEVFRQQIEALQGRIAEKQESQHLEIVAFGSISSGKSSLLNALAGREVFQTDARGGTTTVRNEIPWPGDDKVTLVDTPGLGEIDGAERGVVSADAAKDADLVIMVVDGPLRDWEVRLLEQLGGMEKRILVCLNKSDWYTPREQQSLIGQIRQQVPPRIGADDVLAVRSQVTKRKRIRVLADGSEIEEEVEVPMDISALAARLMQIIRKDGRDLLLANLLLQSRGLVDEAKRRVEEQLDKRAWEIVERYMWGAGGVAALSPLPVLDLAAGVAISTKMVVDLGRVYRQEVDLSVAGNLLAQLAKQLVTILGINALGPALAAGVASLLKTVPGIGTVAGGLLQGLAQALITRWIGAVFIRYFQNEMREPPGGLVAMARQEWARLTTLDELRRLVQSARGKLG
ncbi:MAG: YcjF family protein [Pirellulaceae bacterium]